MPQKGAECWQLLMYLHQRKNELNHISLLDDAKHNAQNASGVILGQGNGLRV